MVYNRIRPFVWLTTILISFLGCTHDRLHTKEDFEKWVMEPENGLSAVFENKYYSYHVIYIPPQLKQLLNDQLVEIENEVHYFMIRVTQKAAPSSTEIIQRPVIHSSNIELYSDNKLCRCVFEHKEHLPGNELAFIYHIVFEHNEKNDKADLRFMLYEEDLKTIKYEHKITKRTLKRIPKKINRR